MEYYLKSKAVPAEAQKPINGGRLKGMTDINPVWRIQVLTEMFGPAGIGWWYVISKQWLESTDSGEIAAFCNIDLFITVDGKTSQAIQGTGGSMFITKESSGLHTSDECFKMALTDALSVACKSIGIGADVYWKAGTKYTEPEPKDRPREDVKVRLVTGYIPPEQPKEDLTPAPAEQIAEGPKYICEACTLQISDVKAKDGKIYTAEEIAASTKKAFGKQLCWECSVKIKNAAKAAKSKAAEAK